MSQAFDKYEKLGAYHWDWYDNPDYAWYKVCVDRCVKFCKGETLDVGCGDGLLAQKIAELNDVRVVGIDESQAGISLAMGKAQNVTFQDHNISWPLDGVWEYMVCLNVIEHLEKPDGIINILNNNITKRAIIITDMPTENKGRYHEHEYTKDELLDTFKEFKPKYFVINSTEFGKPIQFHGVEIKK